MSEVPISADRLTLLEHRPWVRSLARRLLDDPNDVDDVEQETWAAALRSGPDEPRAMRSWLGVVASRFALQRHRGERRRAAREQTVAGAAGTERPAVDVVAEADAHGHVVQAVLALDEPYRSTVLLRYFEGLEIAAVARRMGVPVETVRTRLRRAHDRLRSSLQHEHGRPLALLLAPLGRGEGDAGPLRAPPVSGGAGARAIVVATAAVAVVAVTTWFLVRDARDAGAPHDGEVAAASKPPDRAVGASGGVVAAPGGESAPAAQPPAVPAPPAPAKDDSPPRAAAPPQPAREAWIAYDLADGKPLAGFALRITTARGEETATTDDAGRVPADREKTLDVAADPAGTWTLALPAGGKAKDEASLWFWRERGVSGTVRSLVAARPLVPGDVRLSWTPPMNLRAANDLPGTGISWLMARGFAPNQPREVHVRIDAQGRLSGTLPGLRGSSLGAEATGFSPASAQLAWDGPGDCAVAFELAPTIRVLGRLLDEAGEPVADASVSLEVAIDCATAEDEARARGLRPHGGYIFGGRPGKGVAVLIDAATTDVRGIFRFDAAAVGQASVLVRRKGCRVCRKDLGPLRDDVAAFEMRVLRSESRVTFRVAGNPISAGSLLMSAADGRENGFSLEVGAEGRSDVGWLETGRWYRVAGVPGGKPGSSGCLRWSGQEFIDLDQLPKEPTDEK